jgi:VCBS repeat-containing protein
MTTDATTEATVAQNSNIAHEGDVERVVLTQAATQIQVPEGQNVVRVQVTPGETIQLPFAQGQMVARLDDGNGNLAVRVGDITVILQGYIAATGEGEVTLLDSNGASIDVATVVAATDPNLDIETAAGPAAGAPGAGTDNTGGVFSPFDPAAGLGGLNGIGGLDPTLLNYRLIQREGIVFEEDEEEEEIITGVPTIISTVGGLVNEDDLGSGQNDFFDESSEGNEFSPQALVLDGLIYNFCHPFIPGNDSFDAKDKDNEIVDNSPFGDAITGYEGGLGDSSPYDWDREPLVYKGAVTVDFGSAGAGMLQFPPDVIAQMEALGLTSNGLPLQYQVVGGDLLQGYVYDGECYYLVLQAKIDAATDNGDGTTTYDVYFLLDKNLDHPGPVGGLADETDLPVPIPLQVVDAAGATDDDTITFEVRDDIPFLNSYEYYTPTVHEDALVPEGNAEGGQTTTANVFLSWLVSFGADQPGSYSINAELLASPVDTGLTSLGETVYFVMVDATHIVGETQGGRQIFTLELDPVTGVVTFELKDQVDHGIGSNDDDFATVNLSLAGLFIATDWDDDAVVIGEDAKIMIQNDVPIANDDHDSVANLQSTDGNVITGVDTSDPASGKDSGGADEEASVSAIASVNVPGNTPTATNDATHGDGFVIVGEFGTLTIYADGYYTYTRSNGDPLINSDVFTYTLKDGDTDTDPANLTINIYDEGTELDTDPTGEDAQTVFEKGLPTRTINAVIEPAGTGEAADGDGTDDDDTSEATNGTMSFAAPDGFASLTIDGKDGPVVIANGVTVHGLYGDLLITAFNVDGSGNGTLSYTYTLLDNVDHSGGPVMDDFAVVVEDVDGDTSNGTLNINIINDTPIANNDFDSVGNLQSTDGNVITGVGTSDPAAGDDTVGADDASVSAIASMNMPGNAPTPTNDATHGDGFVIVGEFGTLTIYADGYYTYTRLTNTPLVAAETFTYTLKDGDTDTDPANLTINIYDEATEVDTNPTGRDNQEVDEQGLPIRTINAVIEPAGTGEAADGDGTNDDDTSEATNGTMSFAAPDGFASLTIEGKDGPIVIANGVTVHGLYGDLLITAFNVDGSGNGTLSYTYTLLDNVDHSGGPVTDDFAVVVEDVDGDTSNGALNINIINDTPIANDDVDSLVGIETEATGNVLTGVDIGAGEDANKSDGVADLPGADDGEVSKLEGETSDDKGSDGFSVDGKYGTLVMDKAGNYTYTLLPDAIVPENAEEVFTYTLTDGDGDSDTATLTITVPQTDRAQGIVTASGCVAENNQPNQWSGDQTEEREKLDIAFTPADNETVTGATIDIPTGWMLEVWNPGTNTQVTVLLGTGADLSPYIAGVLNGTLELRPLPPILGHSDVDVSFTLHLDIQDPDTNAVETLDETFTVFVDAVADKPTNVSISITDDGYEGKGQQNGEILGVNDGKFVKDETGQVHVTASFSDLDGSETHTVRVDLPTGFAFQNVPLTIPGVDSYVFDGNDLVLTLSQATTSFSYDFDIVASGVGNNVTFDAYGSTDPFKVTAKAVEDPTDGGCGDNDTDADPNNPDGALDNQSTTIATLNRPNILNGEFVTNTNVQKQVALVTFVDKQDPLRAYAQLIVRGSQGQQGAILTDAGFLIDQSHDYMVGAEATAGTKVIITDMSLEGVRIVDPGNAQVEVNNSPTAANEGTAIVTTINPEGDAGTYVGFEYAKDDPNAGANGALTDTDSATDDYVFGGAGADTITATNNGDNILNGGDILNAANNGADTIIGGSGTDVLVFDPLDTMNGGAGFDIVRVDQGAIFNTMTAEGLALPVGLTNATVDMRNANVTNVESILITEEASPNGSGTKIILNASDVIDFTDDSKDADAVVEDTLYVIGSDGDSLELHLDGGVTVDSTSIVNDVVRGMTFNQYNLSNGGTLIVDSDVTVTTV